MMLQSEIAFYLLRFYLYTKDLRVISNRSRDISIILNKDWEKMKEKIIDQPLSLNNSNVQRVIAIAEDIMNQNKILTIEKLFNVSKKILKIPRTGLISIIHFLINNHVLLEGSKFSSDTVLRNPLRKRILEYIEINGCAHFSNLKKNVLFERDRNQGSSGQLIWHLELLIKFNYIKKMKVGNYSVFLPYNDDERTAKFLFLIKDRIISEIFTFLSENGSIKKSDIYKKIDERREDVFYRINNLIDQNMLKYDQLTNKISLFQKDKKKVEISIKRRLK